jgi:hypothetical protein
MFTASWILFPTPSYDSTPGILRFYPVDSTRGILYIDRSMRVCTYVNLNIFIYLGSPEEHGATLFVQPHAHGVDIGHYIGYGP